MNKKGFVWYLFQQEVIFMMIGLAIGLVFMIAWGYGIIPYLPDLCRLKF